MVKVLGTVTGYTQYMLAVIVPGASLVAQLVKSPPAVPPVIACYHVGEHSWPAFSQDF